MLNVFSQIFFAKGEKFDDCVNFLYWFFIITKNTCKWLFLFYVVEKNFGFLLAGFVAIFAVRFLLIGLKVLRQIQGKFKNCLILSFMCFVSKKCPIIHRPFRMLNRTALSHDFPKEPYLSPYKLLSNI